MSHAHILLFLDAANKYPSSTNIDRIISAKIPDSIEQPQLYDYVKKHMCTVHVVMQTESLHARKMESVQDIFLKTGNLKLLLTKRAILFIEGVIMVNILTKNGISLNNRYVIPYNPNLLLKYQAYLKIE